MTWKVIRLLFKCNLMNICTALRRVSTDTARRAVPRRQLSLLFTRELWSCPIHMQQIKVERQLVQKTDWKQTDGHDRSHYLFR